MLLRDEHHETPSFPPFMEEGRVGSDYHRLTDDQRAANCVRAFEPLLDAAKRILGEEETERLLAEAREQMRERIRNCKHGGMNCDCF